MSPPVVPKRARVVIVGGGIIGCSVAYHLAHAGWRDVVVLERDKITSGTTWHAAGLMVTFGSTSETSTEMRKYSCDLYERLEAETGQNTGFRRTGFIEVASDRDRLEEYRRVSAFNRHMGIDVHEISPQQVKDLFPLAHVDDLHAGFYVKEDGRADPVGVTMALAKGAPVDNGGGGGGGGGLRIASYAAMGAGGAGLIVGVVFGVKARGAASEAEDLQEGDEWKPGIQERGVRNQRIATVGLVAGGALAAGGVILYLLSRESSSERSVSVTPTADGAQLVWGGSF
jgi:hypothetical protein